MFPEAVRHRQTPQPPCRRQVQCPARPLARAPVLCPGRHPPQRRQIPRRSLGLRVCGTCSGQGSMRRGQAHLSRTCRRRLLRRPSDGVRHHLHLQSRRWQLAPSHLRFLREPKFRREGLAAVCCSVPQWILSGGCVSRGGCGVSSKHVRRHCRAVFFSLCGVACQRLPETGRFCWSTAREPSRRSQALRFPSSSAWSF